MQNQFLNQPFFFLKKREVLKEFLRWKFLKIYVHYEHK